MALNADPHTNQRLDKLRKVIKEAFSFFDKVGNNTVFQEEVGTIMRYLGQFPEEDQVVDVILRDMEDDDPSSTTVAYEAFEKLMLRCLMEHSYDPDDSETLLAAFRVLDPDGKGWIDANQMRDYLQSGTVGFREKELVEFLEFAKDRESADSTRIYYEDYVAKLSKYVEEHIENLYQDARK
jgi:Ca2+-binding EF-hand superfamily protein